MIHHSYLFVPDKRPDHFKKAWQPGTDAVILDLEDTVLSRPNFLPEALGWTRLLAKVHAGPLVQLQNTLLFEELKHVCPRTTDWRSLSVF